MYELTTEIRRERVNRGDYRASGSGDERDRRIRASEPVPTTAPPRHTSCDELPLGGYRPEARGHMSW
jgi:hypothetical protein